MMRLKRTLVRLINLISLKKGEDVTDVKGTIKAVKNSLSLKGANLWILTCATFLTCIGLDVNSSTLLIGAMLISPLMNIVLGVGVFQAIYDWENSARAIRNFTIATLVTFIFSVVYFLITPYGELTPSLMARSEPTLMDAFIACIGAVAGIISFTRKEQLAALPGVAISITLMPPVCTIGFALTKYDWQLFFGAFYLFLINAIVIAGSATLVVKLLGFPTVRTITKRQRIMRYNLGIFFVILFLLPSFYLLRDSVSEQEDREKIISFVEKTFERDSTSTVQYEIIESDSVNTVKVTLLGSIIPEQQIQTYTDSFNLLGVKNTRLQIVQPNINKEVVNHLAKTIDNIQKKSITKTIEDKVSLDSTKNEVKEIFPDIKSIELKQSGDKKSVIAELHWKRADWLIMGRKQKLKQIELFLQNKLQSNVEIKEG